jgi:Uma2 family endonuclease
MATTAETPTQAQPQAEPPAAPKADRVPLEQRIALRGVSWETYERLVEEVGDDCGALMAYNGGVLEFMSPGPLHERFKVRLGMIVEILAEERDVPCVGMGSTNWLKPDAEKAVEPDECYLLTAEKVDAASRHLSDDVADYPSPDLAVEIDMRYSAAQRPEIYAALKVPEIWRFDDEVLHIDRLGPDGSYTEVPESQFLAVRAEEVTRWLGEIRGVDDAAWRRRVRAWVRDEVLPRRAMNG